MNTKLTVKQQVELLTPEQRRNIRMYELISGGISLLTCVPLLIFFLCSFFRCKSIMDSGASFWVKEAAHEAFMKDAVVFFVILAIFAIVYTVVFFAFVKRKMPYYSMKKGFYLLTHKDA